MTPNWVVKKIFEAKDQEYINKLLSSTLQHHFILLLLLFNCFSHFEDIRVIKKRYYIKTVIHTYKYVQCNV